MSWTLSVVASMPFTAPGSARRLIRVIISIDAPTRLSLIKKKKSWSTLRSLREGLLAWGTSEILALWTLDCNACLMWRSWLITSSQRSICKTSTRPIPWELKANSPPSTQKWSKTYGWEQMTPSLQITSRKALGSSSPCFQGTTNTIVESWSLTCSTACMKI